MLVDEGFMEVLYGYRHCIDNTFSVDNRFYINYIAEEHMRRASIFICKNITKDNFSIQITRQNIEVSDKEEKFAEKLCKRISEEYMPCIIDISTPSLFTIRNKRRSDD